MREARLGCSPGWVSKTKRRFSAVSNAWNFVAKLTASDGASGDQFGYAVDIDGDTLVVGAKADDSARGTAYVYERDSGREWNDIKKLVASDAEASDYFGGSVSISGDTVAVGAYAEDECGIDAGAAYLFDRDQGGAGNLGEVRKIRFVDGATWNLFGSGIDLDGDNLVVGAWNACNAVGVQTGTAFLFQRDLNGTDRGGLLQRFAADDGTEGAGFGWKVSISGTTIVVGAPSDAETATNAGAAYLFEVVP